MKPKKRLVSLVACLMMLYAVYAAVYVAIHWREDLWDFQAYYYAAKAQAAGLNPYGLTAVSQVAGHPFNLRFTSPPYVLWLFRPFALLNLRTASVLFLAFEGILLALVVFLWAKFFLKGESDLFFYPFTLLAFNSTLLVILLSGNISALEQIGIWLAFVFLLKGRTLLFCLVLILASGLKMTPLFFLVLLPFTRDERKWKYFFGSVLVFGLFQGIAYLSTPLYRDFMAFDFIAEKGWGNPSSFSFFGDLQLLLTHNNTAYPTPLHVVLYAVFVVAVLAVSCRAASTLRSLPVLAVEDRTRVMIFLGCLTYAVVGPRFMAYSQIIVVLPAWFALKKFLSGKEGILLFFLAALQSPHHAAIPGSAIVFGFLWMYYSFLLALALWLLYCRRIFQAGKSGASLF